MDPNYPDVVLRPGGGGRRCKVVFSYAPQNEDELELKEKDEIEFLSEVEEGWWRGCLSGRVGVFPSNFVVELPPPAVDEPSLSEGDVSAPLSSPEEPVPVLPPKPVREQCRVLFSYEAAIEDELSLAKGDIITIISKDIEDKGWWKGELHGKTGLFPDNFVEIINSVDEAKQKPLGKPDRPMKNVTAEVKIDSKIPLISSTNTKKPEPENDVLNKSKSVDLGLIKPDTVASHRKSLEEKVANEAKKPPHRPPVSGKPKPAAAKPITNIKRLSSEITDLVDGALQSKLNSRLKSLDVVEPGSEDLDLDAVSRADMLTNITASRPRAPGRRPPTSSYKDNDEASPLTNGSSEGVKVERSPKERQKQHLPFMDELKVNLKSTKPLVDDVSGPDKKPEKAFGLWGSKINSHGSLESSSSVMSSSVTQESSQIKTTNIGSMSRSTDATLRADSIFATHRTESVGNTAHIESASTTHRTEFSGSVLRTESAMAMKALEDEVSSTIQYPVVSSKESDLKLRVEKLEATVAELVSILNEEREKRRQIEKELVKITDLVTQV